jgi:carboxymethylenebutenolidase
MKKLFACLIVAAMATFTLSAQDWAKARIDKSPRHHEWVKVKHGDREVNCFITYPEVKDKATAVIVIHEIFGLTDWASSVTDELAEAGYIAIAPDLLWGSVTNGGTEELVKSGGNVGRVIQALPPDQITADLNAAAAYVAKLPACNGKVVVAGFCWGGSQSFRFATNNKDVKAAFVFYGTPPAADSMSRINCPVYGFYGGKDARVTSTVTSATEQMKKAGKTYDPVTYEGSGHGFMREGEAPNSNDPNHEANIKARDDSWKRWKELLGKI